MQGERLLNLKDLARVVSTPENGMSHTPLHTSRASSVRSGGSAPVGSVMPSRKASSLLAASSARPVADAQAVQQVAGSPSSRADPTQSNQSTPKRYTEAQKVSPTNATKPAVAKPSTVMKRTASVSTQTPQSDKPDGEDGAGGEKGGGMADRDADSERLALVALEGRAATTLQAWLKGMLGRLKPQIVPGVRVELVLSGVEGVHAGVCRWRGALPQAKKSRSAWLGVELDEPVGRGDGSLPAGHSPSPSVRRYFQCEEGHAAFVATSRCRLENEDFDFDFELDESDDASLDFSIASDATAAVQESQRVSAIPQWMCYRWCMCRRCCQQRECELRSGVCACCNERVSIVRFLHSRGLLASSPLMSRCLFPLSSPHSFAHLSFAPPISSYSPLPTPLTRPSSISPHTSQPLTPSHSHLSIPQPRPSLLAPRSLHRPGWRRLCSGSFEAGAAGLGRKPRRCDSSTPPRPPCYLTDAESCGYAPLLPPPAGRVGSSRCLSRAWGGGTWSKWLRWWASR